VPHASELYGCRITFYLAQTLMAIARHEEAYEWYEKRVALGGWHVSHDRIATVHSMQGSQHCACRRDERQHGL
jgi:hypothetical protein